MSIKRIKSIIDADNLVKETFRFYTKTKSKNFCKFLDMKHQNGLCFLVMEFCDGGPLSDFLNSHSDLSELDALDIFR